MMRYFLQICCLFAVVSGCFSWQNVRKQNKDLKCASTEIKFKNYCITPELINARKSCILNICPTGQTCLNNRCYLLPKMTAKSCAVDHCLEGQLCLNNICHQNGLMVADDSCNSEVQSGPCVGGTCPPGYSCQSDNSCCPSVCTNAVSTCNADSCNTGYTCQQGFCCPNSSS